jgi:hypothetical protein
MNITKLSSIPGRIRLNIEGLKRNSNTAIHIENLLKSLYSINSTYINLRTGNILLTYNSYCIDEDMICTIISSSFIKINSLNAVTYNESKINIYSKELFEDAKSLSKSLIMVSISAASFLLFTAAPIYSICSLVFGIPAILYINSYSSFKYTLVNAGLNNVYIRNVNSVKYIKDVNNVLLHPKVVFNNGNLENLKSMSYYKIESLVHAKKINDPINSHVRRFIKDLRYMGINNISIISDYETNGLISYANNNLGLYETKGDNHHKFTIICGNDFSGINNLNNSTILGISCNKNFYDNNIDIACNELHKISWLFNECRHNEEHLTRSQAIALNINIFGIFLALIKYINLSKSILLYLINILGNLLYIKHTALHRSQLNNNNKELKLWKKKYL